MILNFFKETKDFFMMDIPHNEIKNIMKLTSTKDMRNEIDPNFNNCFRDKPIRGGILISVSWLIFQFLRYKVRRYKTKYPEYLL